MQIYMPFPELRKSLFTLDFKRLYQQNLDAKKIIETIESKKINRQADSVAHMYRNHLDWVKWYYNSTIIELDNRGLKKCEKKYMHGPVIDPPWIGIQPFHKLHQDKLMKEAIRDNSEKNPNRSRELLDRLRFFGIMPSILYSLK